MKVKRESEIAQSCPTLSDPMDCSLLGPLSMGFSRQEYWSGVPLPCQYIICLEDKDSTEQTKSDDLRYTGLHLMEALKSHLFTNTAGYVICISPVL